MATTLLPKLILTHIKVKSSGHTPFGVTGPAQVDITKNNMRTGSVYFAGPSLRLSYRYDSVWGTGWDKAWSIEWWIAIKRLYWRANYLVLGT